MSSVEHCSPLPDQYRQQVSNGEALANELMYAIRDALTNSPRSLQTSIGPSEIGSPCNRRIGYKLLGIKVQDDQRVNWKAAVGTGGHLLMEGIFDRYNVQHAQVLGGHERFYIETKVVVNDDGVDGSCDIYDRVTGTVIDWKFPGPTQLNKYRRQRHPGQQYKVQAHLYGRGWQRAGLPVTRVMVAFLPRNGELDESYIWYEPYDEQVALDALQRLYGITQAVHVLGPAALELLPTADAYCTFCSYFKNHSTDLARGCPGDPASRINVPTPTMRDLVGSRA